MVWAGPAVTGTFGTREMAADANADALTSLWTVAHELRAPLHALLASVELLESEMDTLPYERVQSLTQGIQQRVQWLQELAGALDESSEVETSEDETVEAADLSGVMGEVTPMLEPMLRERAQTLQVSLDGEARVAAGARRVGQVLVNLVQNASKYGAAGLPIEVRVAGGRTSPVRVEVADRGPGLAGDPRSLFAPFERGAAPRTETGVGLGLAIVRSIVEEHGGRVGAANRPEGGALFWFELPSASQIASAHV